jgi:hypothetical protein
LLLFCHRNASLSGSAIEIRGVREDEKRKLCSVIQPKAMREQRRTKTPREDVRLTKLEDERVAREANAKSNGRKVSGSTTNSAAARSPLNGTSSSDMKRTTTQGHTRTRTHARNSAPINMN